MITHCNQFKYCNLRIIWKFAISTLSSSSSTALEQLSLLNNESHLLSAVTNLRQSILNMTLIASGVALRESPRIIILLKLLNSKALWNSPARNSFGGTIFIYEASMILNLLKCQSQDGTMPTLCLQWMISLRASMKKYSSKLQTITDF